MTRRLNPINLLVWSAVVVLCCYELACICGVIARCLGD